MAGFIVLEDGRAYAAANWAFRATVESIARALPDTDEGNALAEWIRNDPTVQIYYNVDVRELTAANREMFLGTVARACRAAETDGPSDWNDPAFFDGWIRRFNDLVKMIDCVRRGEPPEEFNPHMRDTLQWSGERRGPGW